MSVVPTSPLSGPQPPNTRQFTHFKFNPQVTDAQRLEIQGDWIAQLAAGEKGANSPFIQQHTCQVLGRGAIGSRGHQIAEKGAISKQFRTQSLVALKQIPPAHQLAELAALQRYVQDNVRYTLDPYNLERFASPEAVLLEPPYPAEDCDGMAGLYAGMAASVGYPAAVIATGQNGFQHVIAGVRPLFGPEADELERNNRWIPVELTPVQIDGKLTYHAPFGWQNPFWNRFKVWEVRAQT